MTQSFLFLSGYACAILLCIRWYILLDNCSDVAGTTEEDRDQYQVEYMKTCEHEASAGVLIESDRVHDLYISVLHAEVESRSKSNADEANSLLVRGQEAVD